jgi:hypothetical protein
VCIHIRPRILDLKPQWKSTNARYQYKHSINIWNLTHSIDDKARCRDISPWKQYDFREECNQIRICQKTVPLYFKCNHAIVMDIHLINPEYTLPCKASTDLMWLKCLPWIMPGLTCCLPRY